jgi:hypothetical protein
MTLSIALLAFSALCVYVCYSVAKSRKSNVLFWVTMGLTSQQVTVLKDYCFCQLKSDA